MLASWLSRRRCRRPPRAALHCAAASRRTRSTPTRRASPRFLRPPFSPSSPVALHVAPRAWQRLLHPILLAPPAPAAPAASLPQSTQSRGRAADVTVLPPPPRPRASASPAPKSAVLRKMEGGGRATERQKGRETERQSCLRFLLTQLRRTRITLRCRLSLCNFCAQNSDEIGQRDVPRVMVLDFSLHHLHTHTHTHTHTQIQQESERVRESQTESEKIRESDSQRKSDSQSKRERYSWYSNSCITFRSSSRHST